MSIRTVLPCLALAACLIAAPAAAVGKRPVVIELFTSQGCDSCPPADAILGQIAATRHDVLAMSLPVTYWDILGWRDTLASDANTRRQKAYSDTMKRGGIYTPQVIVDGEDDLVGSREPAIDAAIAAREADMSAVPVALSATPQEIRVVVGAGHGPQDATIWLFHILSKSTVSIGGGENSGQKITYRNVVRDVRAVGMWKGQQVTLDLPRAEMTSPPHDAVAVVVQQGGYGRILGAAMLARPDYVSW
ncbi:MAG TPA: DUF1223 domain-containing protein [Rhizomicrobium sp.]|nr:DUF1223 domain-containing protein [Rhizomicrobium sp.]